MPLSRLPHPRRRCRTGSVFRVPGALWLRCHSPGVQGCQWQLLAAVRLLPNKIQPSLPGAGCRGMHWRNLQMLTGFPAGIARVRPA